MDLNPADSLLDGLPPYSESAMFNPSVQLQIQTYGKPWLSTPLPPRPDAIPILPITPEGAFGSPCYISLRQSRSSGSCRLVSGNDAHEIPLSTTTYRFGPGRPPRVRLLSPLTPYGEALRRSETDEEEEGGDASDWDDFEIIPRGLLTRAQTFRTRLGTFEWRYASRRERKAVGANSLLVLDRVVKVVGARNLSGSGSTSKPQDEELRRAVAQLVRNEEFRSPGSSASSAGNGGRLLIDLSFLDEGEKLDREMATILVVTTCLSMLKKEVDRRRSQQIAIMVAAGGAH
jgi:hypothetical protein